VQDLNLEEVRGKFHEWDQVLFLGHLDDVIDDSIQDLMWQGSWSESVMLGRFRNIFVVVNHRLKLFFIGVGHLGGEPNVGFKQISQKVCCPVFYPGGVNVFCVSVPCPGLSQFSP
jgi:hypothetical protein